ncbi:polyprotein [Glycine soja]
MYENNIPLGQDIGEEFHLLSKNSIYEHSRKYKYLHIGCVQVAIKPLVDMGIDATILMCFRDIRHNKFEDSLIGTVETSLGQGPVYFNCYPNKTVSLMNKNILDSLFINIHFHGLDMKEGPIPVALIYRIQYKVMNTCASRDEVTLLEKWVMDKATPLVPRPTPTIEQIKQDNSDKLEITFNRRNSFSSRIEASRSEYESVRRIPLGKTFILQRMNLKGDGFFQHFKGSNRKRIQDKFYEFVERVKINVLFFDWFHAYTIRENLDYPWKQDIIGDPTTNVITNWQIKDGELIHRNYLQQLNTNYQRLKIANYTNKYLQVLGESIKTKATPKYKTHEESPSNVPIEKPLFKPFKVSEKAKQKIRELRRNKSLTEVVGDNNSELLNKLDSLLRVILETPQHSEET